MTDVPEPNDRAIELFADCFQLDREGRARFLDTACADDPDLRGAVEELLRHHDTPAPAVAALLTTAQRPGVAGAPERIGPYRILDVLGRGGMGIVYRAEQQNPRRTVALKVLQPGLVRHEVADRNGTFLKRFEQEAQLLGFLQHPGIAAVHDAGTCDFGYGEMPYFAMELVEGESLTEFAANHKLDVRARCALLATVCDAVQHAHERGVIHRDLKPSNVLVARTPTTTGEAQPKILDFGIARSTDPELQLSTMQTNTGQLLGTLPYMSPEQVSGKSSAIDARSDVYSLGVMLYELLARRLPLELEGRALTDVARVISYEDPTLLGRVDRELRGDIETICDKALAKERERRYGSAAELAEDLRRFLHHEPISARPQTTWYQLKKFASRNRALVGGVAATVLALSIGVVLTTLQATRANRLSKSESEARKTADENAARYRGALYRSEMRAAGDALHSVGGLVRIQQLLKTWLPTDTLPDVRDWEWHLMQAHSRAVRCIELPALLDVAPAFWDAERGVVIHVRDRSKPRGYSYQVSIVDLDTAALGHRIADTAIMKPVVSPDRSRIAVSTGRQLHICQYPSGVVESTLSVDGHADMCSWSPDNELLAVTVLEAKTPDKRTHVVVRRTGTGQEVARLQIRSQRRDYKLAFSPCGRWLASDAGLEPSSGVVLFRTTDWQRDRLLRGSVRISALCWHSAEPWLAVGYRDGSIRIFDAETGEALHSLEGHRQNVSHLQWQPNGSNLVTGASDGTVRLWDVTTGHGRLLGSHADHVRGVSWNPDGRRVATGSGSLRIWDLDKRLALRTLVEPHGKNLGCFPLAWHPDGRRLAVTVSGRTKIFDVRSGRVLEEVAGAWLSFRSDGERIAFRRGRRVIVRATDDPQPLFECELDDGAGGGLAWQPGGHTLAVPGPEGIGVWDPGRGEPRMMRTGRASHLLWSPHDGSLWHCSWSARISRCDPRRDTIEAKFKVKSKGNVGAMCWDPTRSRLAVATRSRSIRVGDADRWDETGRLLHGHSDVPLCIAWHPNGRRLASGGRDRTVRIWDVVSGTEVLVLRQHEEDVASVAWSPDGHRLASLSEDGCVRIWDARPDGG